MHTTVGVHIWVWICYHHCHTVKNEHRDYCDFCASIASQNIHVTVSLHLAVRLLTQNTQWGRDSDLF